MCIIFSIILECSTGKFGFNCNESCDGCLLNYCVKETGICTDTSGCNPGWQPGKPKCDIGNKEEFLHSVIDIC